MRKVKLLALLLAALMVVAAFAGCADTKEIESDVADLDDRVSALEGKVDDAVAGIDGVKDTADKTADDVADLKDEIAKQNAALQQAIKDLTDALKDTSDKVDSQPEIDKPSDLNALANEYGAKIGALQAKYTANKDNFKATDYVAVLEILQAATAKIGSCLTKADIEATYAQMEKDLKNYMAINDQLYAYYTELKGNITPDTVATVEKADELLKYAVEVHYKSIDPTGVKNGKNATALKTYDTGKVDEAGNPVFVDLPLQIEHLVELAEELEDILKKAKELDEDFGKIDYAKVTLDELIAYRNEYRSWAKNAEKLSPSLTKLVTKYSEVEAAIDAMYDLTEAKDSLKKDIRFKSFLKSGAKVADDTTLADATIFSDYMRLLKEGTQNLIVIKMATPVNTVKKETDRWGYYLYADGNKKLTSDLYAAIDAELKVWQGEHGLNDVLAKRAINEAVVEIEAEVLALVAANEQAKAEALYHADTVAFIVANDANKTNDPDKYVNLKYFFEEYKVREAMVADLTASYNEFKSTVVANIFALNKMKLTDGEAFFKAYEKNAGDILTWRDAVLKAYVALCNSEDEITHAIRMDMKDIWKDDAKVTTNVNETSLHFLNNVLTQNFNEMVMLANLGQKLVSQDKSQTIYAFVQTTDGNGDVWHEAIRDHAMDAATNAVVSNGKVNEADYAYEKLFELVYNFNANTGVHEPVIPGASLVYDNGFDKDNFLVLYDFEHTNQYDMTINRFLDTIYEDAIADALTINNKIAAYNTVAIKDEASIKDIMTTVGGFHVSDSYFIDGDNDGTKELEIFTLKYNKKLDTVLVDKEYIKADGTKLAVNINDFSEVINAMRTEAVVNAAANTGIDTIGEFNTAYGRFGLNYKVKVADYEATVKAIETYIDGAVKATEELDEAYSALFQGNPDMVVTLSKKPSIDALYNLLAAWPAQGGAVARYVSKVTAENVRESVDEYELRTILHGTETLYANRPLYDDQGNLIPGSFYDQIKAVYARAKALNNEATMINSLYKVLAELNGQNTLSFSNFIGANQSPSYGIYSVTMDESSLDAEGYAYYVIKYVSFNKSSYKFELKTASSRNCVDMNADSKIDKADAVKFHKDDSVNDIRKWFIDNLLSKNTVTANDKRKDVVNVKLPVATLANNWNGKVFSTYQLVFMAADLASKFYVDNHAEEYTFTEKEAFVKTKALTAHMNAYVYLTLKAAGVVVDDLDKTTLGANPDVATMRAILDSWDLRNIPHVENANTADKNDPRRLIRPIVQADIVYGAAFNETTLTTDFAYDNTGWTAHNDDMDDTCVAGNVILMTYEPGVLVD